MNKYHLIFTSISVAIHQLEVVQHLVSDGFVRPYALKILPYYWPLYTKLTIFREDQDGEMWHVCIAQSKVVAELAE